MPLWLDSLGRDVTYAIRTLRRAPAFATVAVLTLALGIGATTAMFSVVYGILLRPLPYKDPGRLMLVQRQQDLSGSSRPVPALFNAAADIEAWQRGLRSFASTSFYALEVAALSSEQHGNEVIASAVVSDTFFPTLAPPLAAGRALTPEDDQSPSVVISERLATRLFGTPQHALGQTVSLSSRAYSIVGVADSRVQFPAPKTDVWMPAGFVKTTNPRCCSFRMLGRLQSSATAAEAATEVALAAKTLTPSIFGPRADVRATVVSVRDQVVGSVRPALLMLFGAVGLVLLVACANTVNLLLARQLTRDREMLTRRALGASGGRLVIQCLSDVGVLVSAGAAAGVVLAVESVEILKRWQPPGIPRLDAVHVDVPVLLFSIGAAVVAAIAAGLLPAWRAAKTGNASTLGGDRVAGAAGSRHIRRLLCTAQLAVSLVLLIGATVLGRSLVRLLQTDLGVTTDHVVTASMNMAFGGRPTDAQTLERVDRVMREVAVLPGVQTVGAGSALPPNASRLMVTLRRAGDSVDYAAAGVAATPDYFHALGMRLVSGRLFTADDDLDRPPVVIMNVDTARRFFGEMNPIGKTMTLPVSRNGRMGSEAMTLVGIVSNVKYSGLDAAPEDAVYRPFKQQVAYAPFLVVRTAVDPKTLVPTLARAIAAADRSIVVSDVRPLDSIVSDAAAQPRFRSQLLAAIATLALSMAVVGLYGVVSYSVAQRSQEIGVRMALGARQRDVLTMVLREGVMLATAGIAAGLALSFAATRAIKGLVYGVAPTDPLSFAVAAGALFGVALVASYLPSRRAARVDPVVALRHE